MDRDLSGVILLNHFGLEIRTVSLNHQCFEGIDILLVVSGFIDGRLCDEDRMGDSRIVKQSTEGLQADTALSDVVVTIKFGSSRGFGVIAVPDWDIVQADRVFQVLHRVFVAFW